MVASSQCLELGTPARLGAGSSALDVQIMSIDSYQAAPTPADRALNAPFNIFDAPLACVPVIRLFGAAGSGQRVCLHVHQVWPYLLVRYRGASELGAVREFGRQLGHGLNRALGRALQDPGGVFVAAVVPVKGVSFYGYSASHEPFLKIQLTNPGVVARASSLLAAGAVLGRRFNVLESHLPYTLQFLVDFNLYGMGWIHLESVQFRSPLPERAGAEAATQAKYLTDSNVAAEHRWVPQGVPSYLVTPAAPERMSCCELEADTVAAAIMNQRFVRERHIHNQARESADMAPQGRLLHSLDMVWDDEGRRRVQHGVAGPWPPDSRGRGALDGHPEQSCPEPRWSNHWRMQSLLATALAGDSRRDQQPAAGAGDLQISPCGTPAQSCVSPLDTGTSWLDSWPTCREADLGCSRWWLDTPGGNDRWFYAGGAGDGHVALVDQPPGPDVGSTRAMAHGDSETHHSRSPDLGRPKDIVSESGGDTGSEIYSDLGDFEVDDIWLDMEDEASEGDGPAAGASIPQLDGAGDGACSSGARPLRRSGKRTFAPLELMASGAAARHAKEARTTPQTKPQPQARKRAPSACSAPAKRHAHASEHGHTSRNARPSASGVYVDIPHPEGSILKAHYLMSSILQGRLPERAAVQLRVSDADDAPRKQQPGASGPWRVSRVFGPEYAEESKDATRSTNPLDDVGAYASCSERRLFMWGRASIRELNSQFRGAHGANTGWRDNWWEFAGPPPPPRRLLLAPSTHRSDAAPSSHATPAKRRQRDQSDLKWSSVLGKLTQQPVAARPDTDDANEACPPAHPPPAVADTKVPMSHMSLEMLAQCSGEALPDPRLDSVILIAASFSPCGSWTGAACVSAVWTCGAGPGPSRLGLASHIKQTHAADEATMFQRLAEWVRHTDPDVLCGYEVQRGSWGYLIERAAHAYGMQLDSALSRITHSLHWSRTGPLLNSPRARDGWGYRKNTAITVAGRHVLNVWRLMRSELSLTSYTFEKVVRELLGEQQPRHAPSVLAGWLDRGPAVARIRALRHVLRRSQTVLRILDKTRIVTRAAEFARVIGIDFNSVLTRGSQLRVESLMARIAHPELFVLASPTREQVAQQRAAECLPLVLEPQSGYYTDPVVVLDFQSLYPSVMIAYNYCYSTCLGPLGEAATGGARRLGFTSVDVPPGVLGALEGHIH
ncbi:DNA polymerase zeta, partial [Coemansia spiralis]